MMDVEYTTRDPLSDWQDLKNLLNQHDPPQKSVVRRPRQSEVPKDVNSEIMNLPHICCHGHLPASFDGPWSPFIYAIAHEKIIYKPPHAIERLGALMRQTDFIIRVESPFMAVFLVPSLDEYGTFVEIDRQSRWESAEIPEWLRGTFVPNSGEELEWKCRDHGNSFRCTALSRNALGLSWW